MLHVTKRDGHDRSPYRSLDLASRVAPRSIIGDRAFIVLFGSKVFLSGWSSTRPGLMSLQIATDARLGVQIDELQRLVDALSQRRPAPLLTRQQSLRLKQQLMAVDLAIAGHTYREVAISIFGRSRVPDKAWKTHDLRSRTIRLVRTGFDNINGGYRRLLDPAGTIHGAA